MPYKSTIIDILLESNQAIKAANIKLVVVEIFIPIFW